MIHYRHTQAGTVVRCALAMPVVVIALISLMVPEAGIAENPLILGPVLFLFVLLILIFHNLTVTVSDRDIVASFGIGLVKKTIDLGDIKEVAAVRNSPIHGWGVRWIKGGWCYNVSGLDAVQLDFRNGKKFRIGTDEPAALTEAIQSQLQSEH